MVKVPMPVGQDLMRMLSQQGGTPATKTRVLFVDEEMYGPMEFPKSFILGKGQVLKLAAYGKVQVSAATIDTLHCTKEIDEELYDEYKRDPPTSDVDFTDDPVAGGIGPDIARSLEIPIEALGRMSSPTAPQRPDTECPKPASARGDTVATKFL
jgi:hypothetical protein